jgi:carboxyl-terminal processing protease
MPIMRTYRSTWVGLLAIAGSAVIGGFFGGRVLATQDDVPHYYGVFDSALKAVEANYVEKVETEQLIYGAIHGMLQTLDPHSSFMSPRDYARIRERQEGRYYGLGIQILVTDGDITVSTVFEGSPAYQKGLRTGDIIARIEGENTKGWTSDQAVGKLRGQRGTTVRISVRRYGYDELIDMDVLRDEIHIPSIPAVLMVDATTGYVRLQDFTENTDRELGAALKTLSGKGMKRLLLDLRSNPGGPLDQAIRVSNRFLPRGELIVYTRGRVPNSDQDYRATENSDYTDLPIVVLTNRNSASASEIVSGAMQDHDRALIVGETTFGKALVQSVYRVSQGAGLALTTARYFTPSGRMIQRPWDGTFDEYLTYTYRDQKEREHSQADLKYTDSGRQVFSGGGIEPDYRLDGQTEGFSPGRIGRTLYNRGVFIGYAQRFTAEGDRRVTATSKNRRLVTSNFDVDAALVEDFKQYAKAEIPRFDEAGFQSDLEFIRAMVRFEINRALFGMAEARRHLLAADPQAKLALSLFGEAEALNRNARSRKRVAAR